MLGSSVLEVAIGVIFVYLLLSLICTVLNEAIASLIQKRGSNLFEGIKNLLNDPQFTGLAQQLYTHGLVDGISQDAANPRKTNRLPSYMPSRSFALALLDILGSRGVGDSWQDVLDQRKRELADARAKLAAQPNEPLLQKVEADARAALNKAEQDAQKAQEVKQKHVIATTAAAKVTGREDLENIQAASQKLEEALTLGRTLAAQHPDPLSNIQKAVEGLPAGHTKESLQVLIDKTKREATIMSNQITTVGHQVEKLRENIEQWFNDTMDRVTGWYKRWTQKILWAIALILVCVANADTIMLAKRLTRDNALRASIVAAADKAIQNKAANPTEDAKARQDFLAQAEKLNLPLGWVPATNDPYKTDQIPDTCAGWLLKVFGLLVSMFAVSLGAPFWFDTLSKFINLRGAGTPPGETKKSAPQPK